MTRLLLSVFLLASVAHATVTFPDSQVLTDHDLGNDNRAAFKCDNGCQVYSDSRFSRLFITQYNQQKQSYDVVVSFADFGSSDLTKPQPPYNLTARGFYYIENRGDVGFKNQQFVFYVVNKGIFNNWDLDTPVFALPDGGIRPNTQFTDFKMFTILNSKYQSIRFSKYSVSAMSTGNPVIYATGFDTLYSNPCAHVYSATLNLGLESISNEDVTVFAPIATLQHMFGSISVNVNGTDDGVVAKNGFAATVFSSPGFIGCPYLNDISYPNKAVPQIRENFSVRATSLDVRTNYIHLPDSDEAIHLTINGDKLDLYNIANFTRHYNDEGYNVEVKWDKKSGSANFALQLDFKTKKKRRRLREDR